MADRKDVLDFDDDEPTSEELQSQVQKAQDELAELKRRSEQIERDKQRLEELSRRQDELERGKAEMLDKFTRSMVVIQRETQDAEKRLDQLNEMHESFTQHLRDLEAINPKAWAGLDLSKELSKALSSVDDARGDYNRAIPKLAVDAEEPRAAAAAEGAEYDEYYSSEKGILYWLKSGFAFTLPLQIIGWLGLLLWIYSISGAK